MASCYYGGLLSRASYGVGYELTVGRLHTETKHGGRAMVAGRRSGTGWTIAASGRDASELYGDGEHEDTGERGGYFG